MYRVSLEGNHLRFGAHFSRCGVVKIEPRARAHIECCECGHLIEKKRGEGVQDGRASSCERAGGGGGVGVKRKNCSGLVKSM